MLKAVLHVDYEASSKGGDVHGMRRALLYVRDLRLADPGAAIVLVATAGAVWEFRKHPRELEQWHPFGVQFVACGQAVKEFGAPLPQGVSIVPIGVAYVVELQAQGYAYIKVSSFDLNL